MDTAVDLVQILHAAFVAQLLAQGEHHVAQIGIDGFKPIGLLGERAADANRAQRGHRMIDEFHGRSAVGASTSTCEASSAPSAEPTPWAMSAAFSMRSRRAFSSSSSPAAGRFG